MDEQEEVMKDLERRCELLRDQILGLGDQVRLLMGHEAFQGEETSERREEMKANIMLSYRHVEDARMRLGKVMQQIQGGVSIYDKKTEVISGLGAGQSRTK